MCLPSLTNFKILKNIFFLSLVSLELYYDVAKGLHFHTVRGSQSSYICRLVSFIDYRMWGQSLFKNYFFLFFIPFSFVTKIGPCGRLKFSILSYFSYTILITILKFMADNFNIFVIYGILFLLSFSFCF